MSTSAIKIRKNVAFINYNLVKVSFPAYKIGKGKMLPLA